MIRIIASHERPHTIRFAQVRGTRVTTKPAMDITAPGKINLYLRVLSRREDGYHQIETLFERISLFDQISIEPAQKETVITCSDSQIPTGEGSLLRQTVEAFNKMSGKNTFFRINVEKNIPVGAGLGGGSSDAAALLNGLNEISGFPLKEDELLSISCGLGADIPFFLKGNSFSYGTGRGDDLKEIETPLRLSHILINPPFEVSTKDVYDRVSHFDLTKNFGVARIFNDLLRKEDIDSLAKNLRNDLQTIVLRENPILEKVSAELRTEGAKGVLLSGSGPTIFGIFEENKIEKATERLRQIFPEEKGWRIFAAETY